MRPFIEFSRLFKTQQLFSFIKFGVSSKIADMNNTDFTFEPHSHIRHIENTHIEIYFVFYVKLYVSMCLCGSIIPLNMPKNH